MATSNKELYYQRNNKKKNDEEKQSSSNSVSNRDLYIQSNSVMPREKSAAQNAYDMYNKWQSQMEELYKDYTSRSNTYGYKSDHQNWYKSSQNKANELDTSKNNLLNYMDQYKDYIDSDWANSVKDVLSGNMDVANQIVKSAAGESRYFGKWKDSDAYDKDVREYSYYEKYKDMSAVEQETARNKLNTTIRRAGNNGDTEAEKAAREELDFLETYGSTGSQIAGAQNKYYELTNSINEISAEIESIQNKYRPKSAEDIVYIEPSQKNRLSELKTQKKELEEQRAYYSQLMSGKDTYSAEYEDKYSSSDDESQASAIAELQKEKEFYNNKGYTEEADRIQKEIDYLYNHGTVNSQYLGRKDKYEQNEKEIELLNKKLADLDSEVQSRQSGGYTEEESAELKQLKDRRDTLIAENNQYKRSEQGKADEYYKVTKADDFEEMSSVGAAIENPTIEEISAYETALDPVHQQDGADYWNNVLSNAPKVTNKLEFYFSNRDHAIGHHLDSYVSQVEGYQDAMKGASRNWDYFEDNERKTYNYILATEGEEAADAYLDSMQVTLDRRANEASQKNISESVNKPGIEGVINRVGLSIASVPLNVFGGAFALLDDAASAIRGEYNPYSPGHAMMLTGQNARNAISQKYAEDSPLEIMGQNVAGQIYNALMSSADSVLGAATMGHMYTIVMGSSAASTHARELYEKGATGSQIFFGSLTAGVAEALFEYVSIDKLLTERNIESIMQAVKAILVQSGVEATEEIFTDVSNFITDNIVMGVNSDYEQAAAEYEQKGYSRSDALRMALIDAVKETAWSGISGALSGGFSGTVFTGAQAYGNYKTGESIRAAGNENAVLSAAQSEYAGEEANTIAAKINKTGAATNMQLGALKTAIQQGAIKSYDDLVSEFADAGDIKADLVESGMDEKAASKKANTISKIIKGENVSARAEAEIRNDPIAKELLSDYEQTINVVTSLSGIDSVYNTASEATQDRKSKYSKKKTVWDEPERLDVSEGENEGKTILKDTGEEIGNYEIVDTDDGALALKLDNGTTVDTSDVSFASNKEASMIEMFSDAGASAETVNALMNSYDENVGVAHGVWTKAITDVYDYGVIGASKQYMQNDAQYIDSLTEEQINLAYERGRADRAAKVEARKKLIKGLRAGVKVNRKTETRISDDAITDKEMQKIYKKGGTQKDRKLASMKLVHNLAKALGVRVTFYASELASDGKRYYIDENGNRKLAPNGKYSANGEIFIDINSGNAGEGTIIYTLAHELTHFIKDWSPEKFKVLSEMLLEKYAEKGYSLTGLVDMQIDTAKKEGREISRDVALEEVVADSCETFLTDKNVLQTLQEIKQKDTSLFGKIKEFFSKAIKALEKVIGLYDGVETNSQDGRIVAKWKEELADFKRIYAEGLADASDNFSYSKQKNNTSEGVQPDILFSNGRQANFDFEHNIDVSKVIPYTEEESKLSNIDDIRNVARFYNDVKNVLENKVESNRLILVGKPSYILSNYLGNDNLLYIPQGVVRKIAFSKENNGKHGLGVAPIVDMLYQLNDPIIITKNTSVHQKFNDNSIVVVMNWVTTSGDSVIVPIRINVNGNIGLYNNVNTMFNVYDKEYEADLFKPDNILYTKNNEDVNTLLTQRREVPKWKSNTSSDDSISQSELKYNPSEKNSSPSDEKLSSRSQSYSDYDKPITLEDIQFLREITKAHGGNRVSINDFTSEDIQKAQKWAYKFYKELGTKSPFFRAWFGDWRQYDTKTRLAYVTVYNGRISAQDVSRDGAINKDTGWEISVNSNSIDETASKSGKWSTAYHSLKNINDMLENAILLDTVVVDEPSSKMDKLATFIHHFYCPVSVDSQKGIAKLYVTENIGNERKFYLTKIEMESSDSSSQRKISDRNSSNDSEISIAELYDFVKENNDKYEADSKNPMKYKPKSVHSALLNEDGTPKVFYHGTLAKELYEFKKSFIGSRFSFDEVGFFFTSNKKIAQDYATSEFNGTKGEVIEAYLNVKKPLIFDKKYAIRNGYGNVFRDNDPIDVWDAYQTAILDEATEMRADGIVVDDGTSQMLVVYEPTQIKSATDNIGTFDKENTDTRFSSRSSNIYDEVGELERLRKENAELQDDVEGLKQLIKLQKTVTKGTMKTPTAVQHAAKELMEKYGVKSNKDNLASLMNQLSAFYTAVATVENVGTLSWDDVQNQLEPVARWLVDNGTVSLIHPGLELSDSERAALNDYFETELLRDAVQSIYDTYWRATTLYTTADKHGMEIDALKAEHKKAMSKLRSDKNARIEAIKAKDKEYYHDMISRLREKKNARIDETKKHASEMRLKGIENRKQTQLRHKIEKVAKELSARLLNPAENKYVPKQYAQMTKNALTDLMPALDTGKSTTKTEKLNGLVAAYSALKVNTDGYNGIYDDTVANNLSVATELLNGRRLMDLNSEELTIVYHGFAGLKHVITTANKLFSESRKETISDLASAADTEIRNIHNRTSVTEIVSRVESAGWSMLTPQRAMNVIGSDTLTGLYTNMQDTAEREYAEVTSLALAKVNNLKSEYGYKEWELDEKYTYKYSDGSGENKVSLTLGQLMSVYAYSRRPIAAQHLARGGFVEDSNLKAKMKKGKKGNIRVTMTDFVSNPVKLDEQALTTLCDNLTDRQKKFVDEMQDFLSSVLAEKGNEASMKLLGYELFGEEHYFPIRSSKDYILSDNSNENGKIRLKNMSMTKATVPNASNPIVISDFMDVWSKHVNDMALYCAAPAIEDFSRVYYFSVAGNSNTDYRSLRGVIKTAYGSSATNYIETLIESVNNGLRGDNDSVWWMRAYSKFKKAAVFGSLSVIIQQPTALVRAFAYIPPKYFIAADFAQLKQGGHKSVWNECKKYCSTAVLKEYSGYDLTGRSMTEIYKKGKTNLEEIIGKAPALADEITWASIWIASKRMAAEFAQEGSQKYYEKAAAIFNEAVRNTQVYDSVYTRSQIMRSNNALAKMATQFMAEPTTSLNMYVDAAINIRRGGYVETAGGSVSARAFAAKTIASTVTATIFASVMKSIIAALRDDDEDETYWEKYVNHLTSELKDDLNPLNLMPFIKDIVSLWDGYDVNRSDTQIYSEMIKSVKKLADELKKDENGDRNITYKGVMGVVTSLSSIFGFPLKNMEKDLRGIINTFRFALNGDKTTVQGLEEAFTSGLTGKEKTKAERIYEAYLKNDTGAVLRYQKEFKDADAMHAAIRSQLRKEDARIKEAAQKLFDRDVTGAKEIEREIIDEGHFSQSDILAAVNSELNVLKTKQAEEEAGKEKQEEIENGTYKEWWEKEPDGETEEGSLYSAADLNIALEGYDLNAVKEALKELRDKKMSEGKSEKEANGEIKQAVTSYWKPKYQKALENKDTVALSKVYSVMEATKLYGSNVKDYASKYWTDTDK